jgi:hypothetical protein
MKRANGAALEDGPVLPSAARRTSEFPVDVFPLALQRYVREGAAAMQCPLGFFGVPLLVFAGAAIGTSRAIRVKRRWTEHPSFYAALVGEPGDAKTPALNHVAAPLHHRQRMERLAFEERQACYEAEQQRKKGGEGAPVPPPAPMRRYLTTDPTVEALAPILDQNPRGLVVARDELTGWVRSMDQYRARAGADRQFYLQTWSGVPTFVDRKSNPKPIMLDRPFVSVIGGLPPDMLGELRDERGREDGFIHRLVFEFASPIDDQWTEDTISDEAERAWHDGWSCLAALTPNDDGTPVLVDFTPAGKRAFVDWYTANNADRRGSDFPDHLGGPWKKFRNVCARSALVLQELRFACGEAQTEAVDEVSVNGARRLVEHFKDNARRVYARLHASPQDLRLEKVRRWILKHEGRATPRDILRATILPDVKTAVQARAILQDLFDRGQGVWHDGVYILGVP